jgi:ABC-type branched-subunit amino acid transport system substrate-binding protein
MTKQQKFRLGIVADLTPNGSIHQQTFIRAVKAAAEQLDFASNNIELIWENDRANEPGGKAASKILVKKKVDCVMGHFASGAAKGALPQYEKKNIPLLLPAATADALTTSFHSALRICAKDSDLALFIISELKKRKIFSVYIENDNSVHGQSLAGDLVSRISREKRFSIHRNIQDAEHVIFTGTYLNSIDFAHRLQHAPGKVKNIFFTDDLVHSGLAGALQNVSLKIFVFGADDRPGNPAALACTRQYEKQWKTKPNTYYLETYTAMQVAFQLFNKAIKNEPTGLLEAAYKYKWNTVLGSFRFTPEGENKIKRYALWVLRKNGLRKEKNKAQSA